MCTPPDLLTGADVVFNEVLMVGLPYHTGIEGQTNQVAQVENHCGVEGGSAITHPATTSLQVIGAFWHSRWLGNRRNWGTTAQLFLEEGSLNQEAERTNRGCWKHFLKEKQKWPRDGAVVTLLMTLNEEGTLDDFMIKLKWWGFSWRKKRWWNWRDFPRWDETSLKEKVNLSWSVGHQIGQLLPHWVGWDFSWKRKRELEVNQLSPVGCG